MTEAPANTLLDSAKGMLRRQAGFLAFAGSSVAVNAATLIAGVLVLRWIEPAAIGVWQTLLLAQSWLNLIRFGVLNGMNRELPYLLGRNDTAAAYRTAQIAQLHALLCSVLAAAGFSLSLVFLGTWGEAWLWGLAAMLVVAAAGFYNGYLQATFRSHKEFDRLSKVQWLQAAFLLLLPAFAWRWGFAGFCAHAALQAMLVTGCAHALRPIRLPPAFDWKVARQLLATGLPLFVSSYLYVVGLGLERVVLLYRGHVQALGMYAPAVAVLSAMAVVPAAVSMYLYPRISFHLGQTQDPRQLWKLSRFAIAASVGCGLPVVLLGWPLIPPVVAEWFPAYAPAVPAMRISLLTGLMLGFASGTTLLGSLKAWKLQYIYVGTFLAAKAFFPWYWSSGPDPVTGVAWGGLLAATVTAVVAVWVAYRATHQETGRAAAAMTEEAVRLPGGPSLDV